MNEYYDDEVTDYSKHDGCSHFLLAKSNPKLKLPSGRSTMKFLPGEWFKIGDYVDGLQYAGNGEFAYTFCSSCAQEYKRPSKWVTELNRLNECTKLLPVLVNIILDYLAPPFTLIKNDEKLVLTSTYIDWVKFLHVDLEEDSKTWYINCNLDSLMYGCIMLLTEQNDLFITGKGVDDIKEFEQLFEKKLAKNNLRKSWQKIT
jgi:hypothetical protein